MSIARMTVILLTAVTAELDTASLQSRMSPSRQRVAIVEFGLLVDLNARL